MSMRTSRRALTLGLGSALLGTHSLGQQTIAATPGTPDLAAIVLDPFDLAHAEIGLSEWGSLDGRPLLPADLLDRVIDMFPWDLDTGELESHLALSQSHLLLHAPHDAEGDRYTLPDRYLTSIAIAASTDDEARKVANVLATGAFPEGVTVTSIDSENAVVVAGADRVIGIGRSGSVVGLFHLLGPDFADPESMVAGMCHRFRSKVRSETLPHDDSGSERPGLSQRAIWIDGAPSPSGAYQVLSGRKVPASGESESSIQAQEEGLTLRQFGYFSELLLDTPILGNCLLYLTSHVTADDAQTWLSRYDFESLVTAGTMERVEDLGLGDESFKNTGLISGQERGYGFVRIGVQVGLETFNISAITNEETSAEAWIELARAQQDALEGDVRYPVVPIADELYSVPDR